MATLSKPISISSVATTLGAGSRDLAMLCINANINKWAAFKPIRYNSPGELMEADMRNANYGLQIPTQQSSGVTAAQDSTAYAYLKPRGLVHNEWYRLLDFNGYKTDARAIATSQPEATVDVGSASVAFNLTIRHTKAVGEIALKEFPFLQGKYIALVIVDGGVEYYRTSQGAIDIDDLTDLAVNFPTNQAPFNNLSGSKSLTGYWVCTDKRYSINDSVKPANAHFWALPFSAYTDARMGITARKSGLSWNFLRIGNEFTGGTFKDLADISQYAVIRGTSVWPLLSNCTLTFGLTVTNTGESMIVLTNSQIKQLCGPCISLDAGTGDRPVSAMYYADTDSAPMNFATSVQIPGGQTKYIAIRSDNLMRYREGVYMQSITPQYPFAVQLEVKFGGDNSSAYGVKMQLENI